MISGDGTVQTVRAIASATGSKNSAVASATYSISYGTTTLAPTLSVAGGTYAADIDGVGGHPGPVALSCGTAGASIYYTTDGSMPTIPPTGTTALYGAPISISGDGTVRTITARASASGLTISPVTQATYAIHYPIASPTFSVAGGSFTTNIDGLGGHPGPVVISDTDGNADIYYTTNGSAPTTSSTKINHGTTGTVSITGDGTVETINALAVDSTGVRTQSAVTSATYSIAYAQVAGPTFAPAGASYTYDLSGANAVAISCGTAGSAIYYTIDGSTPTIPPTGSTALYGAPINISGDGTVRAIRAIASATGMKNSPATSAAYFITYSQVQTPAFSQSAGNYSYDLSGGSAISISCGTAGATIHFTTDGSAPTAGSPSYTAPISVSGDGTTQTIRAIAVATGMRDSASAAATYAIHYLAVSTPTFDIASGIYGSNQTVTITDATGGATIYYTTDGTTPSIASPLFGPATGVSVSVSGSSSGSTQTTIKAIAVLSGRTTSGIASASYVISYAADGITPVIAITPAGRDTISADGTHITATSAPSITLSGGTASTVYYYSIALNGTPAAPTIGGTSVSGPIGTFPVTSYGGGAASTVTVKAFAVDPQTTPGATATATFTINSIASTPALSLISGTRYIANQNLSISDTTPGATIYAYVNPGTTAVTASPTTYTNTGASPVSTVLSGPLNAYTVTAMAMAPGYAASP